MWAKIEVKSAIMQCIYLRKRVTLYVGDGCEALSRMMIPAQAALHGGFLVECQVSQET